MSKTTDINDIDDAISKVHELLDAGFYAEEYLSFTRSVEECLSILEEKTTAMSRKLRKAPSVTNVLTLYVEDFEKTHDWNAVCEQLDVNADGDVTHIELEVCSVIVYGHERDEGLDDEM